MRKLRLSARTRTAKENQQDATPPRLSDLFRLSSVYSEAVEQVFSGLFSESSQKDPRKELGDLFPKIWDSGPRYLALIEQVVLEIEPKVVVETGVAHGISSRHILQVFDTLERKTGFESKLHSIDVDARTRWPDLAEDSRWTFHLLEGDHQIQEVLEGIGPIDLFIHDSDHSYGTQMREYQTAWRLLNPGGVLISDDVNWSRAFLEFCLGQRLTPVFLSEAPKVAGAVRKPFFGEVPDRGL